MNYPFRLFTLSIFLFLFGLLLWMPLEASLASCSAEINGDNTTDFTSADATAVQQAADAVADGGTIKLAGTCTGVQTIGSNTQTVVISRSVTLQGGYLATDWQAPSDPTTNPTTLDADDGGRVIYIPNTVTVTLDSLIIRDGVIAGNGAGILHEAGTLTIQNTQLISNTATQTGGGVTSFATLNITNTIFTENQGTATGSAIYGRGITTITHSLFTDQLSNGGTVYNESGATMTINKSQFSDNLGRGGGGLSNSIGGQVTIDRAYFTRNLGLRGGVINNNIGTITVTNSILDGNIAFDRGGAIVNSGTITVRGSTISNNIVSNQFIPTNFGGAVVNGGTFVFENSTMSGNVVQGGTSASGGGAIDQFGGSPSLTILHSTIVNNSAPNVATARDGIWIESGSATVRNSIIANNGGADCILDGGTFDGSGVNLASDGTCTGFTMPNTDPLLGALQDNGGFSTASGTSTPTHLPADNSPVIAAGNSADCLPVDQRNGPRALPNCDLGSVEFDVPYTAVTLHHSGIHTASPRLILLLGVLLTTITFSTRRR